MTITATTNRIQYTGDGSSTGFAFPFRIFAATDLEVFLAGVLQTTGYSVTGGSPSGTVNPCHRARWASGAAGSRAITSR